MYSSEEDIVIEISPMKMKSHYPSLGRLFNRPFRLYMQEKSLIFYIFDFDIFWPSVLRLKYFIPSMLPHFPLFTIIINTFSRHQSLFFIKKKFEKKIKCIVHIGIRLLHICICNSLSVLLPFFFDQTQNESKKEKKKQILPANCYNHSQCGQMNMT